MTTSPEDREINRAARKRTRREAFERRINYTPPPPEGRKATLADYTMLAWETAQPDYYHRSDQELGVPLSPEGGWGRWHDEFVRQHGRVPYAADVEAERDRLSQQLLTISQAAEQLGVTRARVDQHVRKGRLPVQWFGPVRMVKPADLALIEKLPPGRKPQPPA